MTQHDYKAAQIRFDHHLTQAEPEANGKKLTRHGGAYFTNAEIAAIRHALKVADKLMQEPSEGMILAIEVTDTYREAFKAMRDKMLKEVE